MHLRGERGLSDGVPSAQQDQQRTPARMPLAHHVEGGQRGRVTGLEQQRAQDPPPLLLLHVAPVAVHQLLLRCQRDLDCVGAADPRFAELTRQ